ncbi:MAG: DNA polymerase IV [Coxiella sp. (in: Bacteria)]|nr:MAG: DNA polymerase IV [Coxiella sp. (in: g-proteobacteria)]
MVTHNKHWPRAIILIDMNAFFASIEQLDNPTLRNKPVAVTNGTKGSCIITCSYEARAYGIHTGMRLKEAYQRCPDLIRCSSRHKRYTEVSTRIMRALYNITPDIEIFSVDEAFLDVTHCQLLHGHPIDIGYMTQCQVWQASQLPCSIGISGDKTTAKYAAKLHKPNGFSVIPPWRAKEILHDVPVTELCGIGPGIGRFLATHQVYTCGDMQKLPISILSGRFGNLGRRIWYMCQGADPDPVKTKRGAAKSMGHGKVLPPNTRDKTCVLTFFLHMSEKVAARLRQNQLCAQHFFIGFKTAYHGWISDKIHFKSPTNDGLTIYAAAKLFTQQHWQTPIIQVQITALDPHPEHQQTDLFEMPAPEEAQLNRVSDKINQRFGDYKIMRARLLQRSDMPDVIPPTWRPDKA